METKTMTNTGHAKNMGNGSLWLLLALFLSVTAFGISSITYWHQLQQPQIVTIDLVGLATTARHRLHTQESMALFARNLQRELKRLSQQEHLVIMSSRAVAAGTPDITRRVRRELLP